MNYLPLLILALFLKTPNGAKNQLSLDGILSLIKGLGALKQSGLLEILRGKNPVEALLSGEIPAEKIMPLLSAFAPLFIPKPTEKTIDSLPEKTENPADQSAIIPQELERMLNVLA